MTCLGRALVITWCVSTAVFLQGCSRTADCSGQENVEFDQADPEKTAVRKTQSASACEKLCVNRQECKYWKWYDAAQEEEKRSKCYLFSSKAGETRRSGVTSGGPCRDRKEANRKNHGGVAKDSPRYTCNNTLFGMSKKNMFLENLPMTIRNDCISLAEELQVYFNATPKYKDTENGRNIACYLQDNSLHFGHINSTAATLCQKAVQTPCRSHTNTCKGTVDMGDEYTLDLSFTPFADYGNKATEKSQMFLRRKCKTERCEDQEDKLWCCDVMRTSSSEKRNVTVTDNRFKRMLTGYRLKKFKPTTENIFLLRKNGSLLNSYSVNYDNANKCTENKKVLETEIKFQTSSESSSESEESTTYHAEVSASYMFVSVSAKHESSEARTQKTQEFIDESAEKSLSVEQHSIDCFTEKLVQSFDKRPLFTPQFLDRLRKIQRVMEKAMNGEANESSQKTLFIDFADQVGFHVIKATQWGSSSRKLTRFSTTSKSSSTNTSSENCKESSHDTSVDVEGSYGGFSAGASGGMSKNKRNCNDESSSKAESNSEKSLNESTENIGKCDCSDGRNIDEQTSELLSFEPSPLLHVIKNEWLEPSAWFGIYHKYDATLLLEFFYRWFSLEYPSKETCFFADSKINNSEEHQIARAACSENADPESCNLHMCKEKNQETNTTNIHSPCEGTECEIFCCIKAESEGPRSI